MEKCPNIEIVLELKRYLELQIAADPKNEGLKEPITEEEWAAADKFDASRPDLDPEDGEYEEEEEEEEDDSEEEEIELIQPAPKPLNTKPKAPAKPKAKAPLVNPKPKPIVPKVKTGRSGANVRPSIKNFPSAK